MAENQEPKADQRDLTQEIKDKFESTKNEVSKKIEDIKNSEFGEKVADVAGNVRDKAKDVIEDIKESEFAEKIGDVAGNVVGKTKNWTGEMLEKLGTLAKLPVLIKAGKKLQESANAPKDKVELLHDLDTKVAAILEDGVITPEEEAFLVQEAKAIGIDAEEFLAEVRERLPKKE